MMGESPEEADDGALERVRRHVRILVDIGRIAGVAEDLSRFLDQVVVQVARAVEIDHTKVLQYRPKQADFVVAAGMGWKEGVVRTATLGADISSAPGRAYRTGEPVTVRDFAAQSEFARSEFLADHEIVSLTNVPIFIDGAAWGVLEVDSTAPRDFSEDTTDFLMAAGALIGAFLQRHHSHVAEAERILARTQAEIREILLREMQHRVKNNFQLILSSIAIQKRRHRGADVHRALDHINSRINAISLAHDQLAPRDRSQVVKLSDYIRALSESIRQQTDTISIDVETDELELPIERAVPLGLILNEAATNSIKHAFGPSGGAVLVKLVGGVGYGEARLTISDNGGGMRDSDHEGSGLKLIESLARQVGGSVDLQTSGDGTTVSVVFPLIG
jgi:two-component system, sensor histidine kinase PdtaS